MVICDVFSAIRVHFRASGRGEGKITGALTLSELWFYSEKPGHRYLVVVSELSTKTLPGMGDNAVKT